MSGRDLASRKEGAALERPDVIWPSPPPALGSLPPLEQPDVLTQAIFPAPGPVRPLRIVYVLKMFPRLSETFILNEILALEAMGHEVSIFSRLSHAETLAHEAFSKVRGKVTYVPAEDPGFNRKALLARVPLLLRSPARYRQVARYAGGRGHVAAWQKFLQANLVAREALRIRADHIHAHFLTGNARVAKWASALSGISYSVTAHAKDIYANSAGPRVMRRRIDQARFIVTISDYNRRHLAALASSPESIFRIYNGVDLQRIHPSARRPDSEAGRPIYFLSVGRLVRKKGFSVLIQACALLHARGRDFRCDIIGGGEEEAALRAQIRDLGLDGKMRLLGPRVQEEILREFYPRADLLVLPCVVTGNGDRDGIPTVLIEAMAMGIPILSTRVSGIPELVEQGGSGLLVEPTDPLALADGMESLLGDAAARRALGEAGRRRVDQDFDLRRNAALLADLYGRYSTGWRLRGENGPPVRDPDERSPHHPYHP